VGGPAFFFQCRFRLAAAGLGVQPRVDMNLTTRETAAAFVRYVHTRGGIQEKKRLASGEPFQTVVCPQGEAFARKSHG